VTVPAHSAIGTGAFVAVALGAVLGAWLRWGLALWLNSRFSAVPLGTLMANMLGGLLAGAALAWLARHPELSAHWRLFLITGFMGALTTFSSFSLESFELLQRGEIAWAFAHSLLHLLGALAATALGWWMLR
jgi:CrcB protein